MNDIRKKFEEKYTDDFLKTCGYKSDFDEYLDNPMIQEEYQIFCKGAESQQPGIDKLQKILEEKKDVLEKISQIDWSHTKESESVKLLLCIEWAEQSCKEIE